MLFEALHNKVIAKLIKDMITSNYDDNIKEGRQQEIKQTKIETTNQAINLNFPACMFYKVSANSNILVLCYYRIFFLVAKVYQAEK